MKLLVDMNLSPRWVGFLATHEIDAEHWSHVGDPRASDATIIWPSVKESRPFKAAESRSAA